MNILVTLLVVLVFSSMGCSKKDETLKADQSVPVIEPVAPATEGATPTPAPTPIKTAAKPVDAKKKAAPAGPVQTVFQQEIVGEIHANMTMQLRLFIQQKGRMPTSFSEFTSARMDSVPFPPAGKMYVIDAATQTVKIVKKQ